MLSSKTARKFKPAEYNRREILNQLGEVVQAIVFYSQTPPENMNQQEIDEKIKYLYEKKRLLQAQLQAIK